ncbi:MAG: hypothetical protein PPFGHCPK_01121 [Spiroplasma endosymbiont of Drosophila atripex]|nr:MAG: hypothetical protein PPFGHCPK_01121 [Spiroplasma endosymbiont of Drosophila atripex]
MKIFNINYWFKVWTLTAFSFEQQNKKTHDLSIAIPMTNNEMITRSQLLIDNKNITTILDFNLNRIKRETNPIDNINIMKIYELNLLQIQELTEKQIQNIQVWDITIIREKQISWFKPEQISWFKSWQISEFTEKQIQSFTEKQIKSFEPYQIQAFTPKQISWFKLEQIPWFTSEQVQYFTQKQIQSFTEEQINKFTPEKTKLFLWEVFWLTSAQLSEIAPEQIAKISLEHFLLLTISQIKALTPIQIKALTREQIEVFRIQQIKALTPIQISWFKPEQISEFTEKQIQEFLPLQIRSLTPAQVKSLTKQQVSSFYLWQILEFKASQLVQLSPLKKQYFTSIINGNSFNIKTWDGKIKSCIHEAGHIMNDFNSAFFKDFIISMEVFNRENVTGITKLNITGYITDVENTQYIYSWLRSVLGGASTEIVMKYPYPYRRNGHEVVPNIKIVHEMLVIKRRQISNLDFQILIEQLKKDSIKVIEDNKIAFSKIIEICSILSKVTKEEIEYIFKYKSLSVIVENIKSQIQQRIDNIDWNEINSFHLQSIKKVLVNAKDNFVGNEWLLFLACVIFVSMGFGFVYNKPFSLKSQIDKTIAENNLENLTELVTIERQFHQTELNMKTVFLINNASNEDLDQHQKEIEKEHHKGEIIPLLQDEITSINNLDLQNQLSISRHSRLLFT